MIQPAFNAGEVIFALEIDFKPDSPDPGRVFRSMASLVDAVYQIDVDLARSVSLEIRPIQLLHTVEAGSLRTWLRTVLVEGEDEEFQDPNWQPAVARYLVRAKVRLFEWLQGRDEISSVEDLERLETDLRGMAEETNVLRFPSYAAIPRKDLLEDIQSLGAAVDELEASDTVTYKSPAGITEIGTNFSISSQQIEEILTAEERHGTYELIMLLKKPDYLGSSMWEFRLDGHTVEAKMLDQNWLEAFRARAVDLRPGDGLRARVRVGLRSAADGSTISIRYEVREVIGVIKNADNLPAQLLDHLGDLTKDIRKGEDRLLSPGTPDNSSDVA